MSSLVATPDIPSQDIAGPDGENALASDQMELTIEIGQTRLTLSEMQQLRPGAILGLKEYLNDPVTIFAGTRIIGRGELLTIEGKLGVRISELYRHPKTD